MKLPRMLLLTSVCFVAGCIALLDFVGLVKPEGPPSNEQIYSIYRQTVIDQSTSGDVLMAFGRPEYALLSQSKSVVALAGEKKKGYEKWFNMVAFDENSLLAKR